MGKQRLVLREIPFKQAIIVQESWQEISITASSLRLDTMISAFYHISRQKAQVLIGQGLAKVNWTVIENSSFDCHQGDTISVRGFNRVKIVSIEGKTKKDKWRIIANSQK